MWVLKIKLADRYEQIIKTDWVQFSNIYYKTVLENGKMHTVAYSIFIKLISQTQYKANLIYYMIHLVILLFINTHMCICIYIYLEQF